MRAAPFETIEQLFEGYIETRIGQVANVAAIRAHAKSVNSFFGQLTLKEISEPYVLQRYCKKYVEAAKDKPNTVQKRLRVLQAAIRWAWKQGHISLPVMYIPDAPPRNDRILTEEEISRLFATADQRLDFPHVRTFVYLVLLTGQNKGPVVGLTWDRVRDDHIVFDGEYGNDRVKVKIADDRLRSVLARAKEERKRGCNFVVQCRGKGVENVQHALRALLAAADLDDVTVHDLRRTGRALLKVASVEPDKDAAQAHLFISYCNADGRECANDLVLAVERLGHGCWMAPRNMKAGAYPAQLGQAIEEADALLLLVTPAAIESANVLQEVMKAHRAKKVVIPIIVDRTNLGGDLDFLLGPADQIPWTSATETAAAILNKLGR